MEVITGSCRLGLWFVHVHWNDAVIYRARFATTAIDGPVPPLIRRYCAGQKVDLLEYDSVALHDEGVYTRIYRAVRDIPYGKTVTYGAIARLAGTVPRVVGQAMARNPTPLVIPCHRVVAAQGIGGFSPSVEVKKMLLDMERRRIAA